MSTNAEKVARVISLGRKSDVYQVPLTHFCLETSSRGGFGVLRPFQYYLSNIEKMEKW